ncbi:MAG: hypothetical protein GY732_23550 [Gammaproteobacteria bacterium]|nr:hypothetical protein [Gammaproteobacteria bacterium]
MMTEHRDPVLQTLFAADQVDQTDQDAQAFTARVMTKTRKLIYQLVGALAAVVLALLVCVWVFAIPLQDVVQLVTQTVSATLFDLGDGWASWVFTPVNNIASLIVISLKAIRVVHKKVLSASYTT